MTEFPTRNRSYTGPVTDTRNWDGFELRPGDVVLSTPPKCGTTWSQAIIMMLILGGAPRDLPAWRQSHWLEFRLGDPQEAKTKLEAQNHRRCIKSHAPLDGIPFHPEVTYITVSRHPLDVFFSMQRHVENMRYDILDHLYPPEPGAALQRFLTREASAAGTDDLSLASILYHYRSFTAWAHLPNIHFFHYADLSRDLRGQAGRYAQALGIKASDRLLDEIASSASFSAMKQTTRALQPAVPRGAFVEEHKFFDSATSEKWKGRLSDAELKAYRSRIAACATPSEIAYLESAQRAVPVTAR